MQRITSNIGQGLQKSILVLGLMILIIVSSLLIFVSAPVYATTLEEQKLIPADQTLTPEEKIDRAYELNEGAGILEEAKQESANANKKFNPNKAANLKNVKASKQADSEPNLLEKAQQLVEKVTGKE